MALLEVKDLTKHFPVKKGIFSKVTNVVKAVDGINFTLEQGETLGLVGESGCGKTTVGRSVLRLIEPTSGHVTFNGKNLLNMDKKALRKFRADFQIIFQDPFSSLNPRMRIGSIIAEPIKNHLNLPSSEIMDRVEQLMKRVGLHPEQMNRYPHEFSGGQRQRIGIARALALNPKVIICDEPVSALDVSVQAQVINLLAQLQEELNLSYLFIAHDLSVVEHISDRIAVMYMGRIVELAADKALYENPLHPYSQALLSAVPVPDPDIKKKKVNLKGEIPSPLDPPTGCIFHPRCLKCDEICFKEMPEFREIESNHWVSCHGV